MASISKKIGAIAARTTTGSQQTTGVGFQPKFLMLWTNNNTSDTTAADMCLMAQGMSDGTTSAWAAYASKDNQTTSKTRSSHSTAAGKIIGFADPDNTLIFEASLTSFDSDGFTLNYDTVDGVARQIQYLAIGGDGQFKVGTGTSLTGTGLQTISGVGFAPTGCIFLCPRVVSGSQTQAPANFGYGFSDSGGQQAAQVVYSTDNFGAGLIDCGRRSYTDLCMQAMNNTPSGALIARYSSYNGDGLVLNWTTVEGTAYRYIYCCIGKLKCRVQEDTMKTTTGNQAYTGSGFTPSVILQTSNTINGWFSENLTSNGAAVSTSQRFVMSAADKYQANPTNGHYGQDSTKMMQTRFSDVFTVIQATDLVSFDSDGYTANYTTVNGNADKLISMMIGETSEETKPVTSGESLSESTTTQTSDQDKLSVVLSAEASATYYIIATWQGSHSAATADHRSKLVNTTDAVTYQSTVWELKDASDYVSFMGLGIFTNGGSPASKTFKIQYSAESGTAAIKNARIIIIKKGAEDQNAEDTGRITTTSASDTDATTLTFTPGSAGWYLFLAAADLDNSSTTPRTKAIIDVDGTNVVSSEIHVKDITSVRSWGAMYITNLSKASHSIKIQYATTTATTTTAGIQRRRIIGLRLDKFLNGYFDNSTAASRTTMTSVTYADKAAVTKTPLEGDHIVLGHQTVDENSTSISFFSKLLENSTDFNIVNEEPSNASDRVNYAIGYVKNYTASSQTWKLQYATETAGTAAGAAESKIIILQISSSYTQYQTTDALLQDVATKTHTTDASLKGSPTKTHSTDALLKKTETKTHTTDSLLQDVVTGQHTTDSLLLGVISIVQTTDALLWDIFTLTHTTDALLRSPYSREAIGSLPADNDDTLATQYSPQNIIDVSAADDDRVRIVGNGYLIHQFKNRNTNSTNSFTVEWEGQSFIAPSVSTVYLQIFNRTDEAWETLDSDSSSAANTDFTLSGGIFSDHADYYGDGNIISCRVYQYVS